MDTEHKATRKARDYLAELFVAGRFADAGWNVYFPHRDKGFDFIVTKSDGKDGQIVRLVQVKGKYPEEGRKPRKIIYGYVGRLSQVDPEMVLTMPFFTDASTDIPACVAYLPRQTIKTGSRGYLCKPANCENGQVTPRKTFAKFFDASGLTLVESPTWKDERGGTEG